MDSIPPLIAYHFWSPTCEPCTAIKPILADLIEEFPGIYFIGINIKDDPQGISEKFKITHVPTILFLKNGVEIARYTGSSGIMFYTLCRKALAS
jgi:thiol-disulfide isomerase/thioredoxin